MGDCDEEVGIWTVFALTIISALHYVFLLGVRLRAVSEKTGVSAA
ncbi:MAG TPA: hypothetical protein VN517_10580 [Terriglobales bacterium]|nr:hypothetical protein [Terriglobales bacterium]